MAKFARKFNNRGSKGRRPITDEPIDYTNVDLLSRFITERGKLLGRKSLGTSAKKHREITKAVKRARALGILAFTSQHN